MMVVDRLSKVAHFVVVKPTNSASGISQIFIREIVTLHGISKNIFLDKDVKFTCMFRKELFTRLGTKLAFSTSIIHK